MILAKVPVSHLKVSKTSEEHDGLPVVLHEGVQHEKEGVADGEFLQALGAVVVDDHLLPGPFLEEVLSFFGGSEVGEGGLALLEPLPIKAVAAVHVDGAADVVHVVGDERATVDEEESAGVGLAAHELGGQLFRLDGFGVLQQERSL